MKKYVIPFLLLATLSCTTIKTSFDYDKQIDFSQYKSYAIVTNDLLPNVGELDRNRIVKAVETEMAAKGITKSDNPDLLLAMEIKTQEKMDATATTTGGYGYGRYGYGYGGGFSTTQISYDEYTDGTLIIYVVDNETQKIVWLGNGTKTLSETASADKKETNINYSVQQILKNYPPVQ